MTTATVTDRAIVVAGWTGKVGTPVALALAADDEVHGSARFEDPAAREEMEATGVICLPSTRSTPTCPRCRSTSTTW